MTPDQNELVERIRQAIVDEPVQREVTMFGVRTFLINDKMITTAQKDGALLVRVSDERFEELRTHQGASQPTIGPGRGTGTGWLSIDPAALDDDQLAFWIGAAMEHNQAITGIER